MKPVGDRPVVLVNHLGYDVGGPAHALLAAPPGARVTGAWIEGAAVAGGDSEATRRPVRVGDPATVAGWGPVVYRRLDLGSANTEGEHRVVVEVDGARVASEPFRVERDRLVRSVVADITAYFRSVRSSGEIDRKDARAAFWGDDSGRTVDAHGGWLDASGDTSKFLSHLTYTRMMSPQQIPLVAWALMAAGDELRREHPGFRTSQHARLRDEALFGADFLVRFRSPEGFFYTGIFDALTKRLDERVITAPLQDSVRTSRWQAAYRHGGGLAIAALARASTLDDHGDATSAQYLAAAVEGFSHLEQHNREYLFDGEESVIDDYAGLLAATELVVATGDGGSGDRAGSDGIAEAARAAAGRRAAALVDRLRHDETGAAYLVGDVTGRPYFHAAESGLPIVALLRFAESLPDHALAEPAASTAFELLRGIVARVDAVPNPFGYLRQRVQPTDGEPRDAFFYPHENETGYWWQGENANIASVAYAARLAARRPEIAGELGERLRRLAADLVDWVVGRNPFDACMLQGRGRNWPEYSAEYQNTPGGIVNGITSGFEDEDAIAFLPDAHAEDGEEWRWSEQWIPHSAWFLLAVCAG